MKNFFSYAVKPERALKRLFLVTFKKELYNLLS
jgi:hypothetical protein